MLLKMLELGMQVDVVLFCETGLDFPEIEEHIRKVEQNTGITTTRVRSEYSYEYLMLHKPIKRKKPELQDKVGYSWAGPLMRWCTNLLKTVPREKYLSELRKKYDVVEYIGIACDETERITHKCNCRPNVRLPLVEWGMTEADCLQYCKEVCMRNLGECPAGAVPYSRWVNCESSILISPTSGNSSESGTIKHGVLSSRAGQSDSLRYALILKRNGRTAATSSALRNSGKN